MSSAFGDMHQRVANVRDLHSQFAFANTNTCRAHRRAHLRPGDERGKKLFSIIGEKFRRGSTAAYAAWVALKRMAEIADFGQIPITNTRPFTGEMCT
jgi:hypothetical protein